MRRAPGTQIKSRIAKELGKATFRRSPRRSAPRLYKEPPTPPASILCVAGLRIAPGPQHLVRRELLHLSPRGSGRGLDRPEATLEAANGRSERVLGVDARRPRDAR